MTLEIRQTTVAQLSSEPNFDEILAEYGAERELDGLPSPKADLDMYKKLEEIGGLQVFSAYFEGILIGFVNVLVSKNPHYGLDFAYTESFFVLKNHRKTGAGIELRKSAEKYAILKKCPALIVSAAVGSNMEKWMETSKEYISATRSFIKCLI